jgi:hypothetical protein
MPVAVQSKARMKSDCSNNGIVGSNPYSRFSVLCYPVYVKALQWADPTSKGLNQNV